MSDTAMMVEALERQYADAQRQLAEANARLATWQETARLRTAELTDTLMQLEVARKALEATRPILLSVHSLSTIRVYGLVTEALAAIGQGEKK